MSFVKDEENRIRKGVDKAIKSAENLRKAIESLGEMKILVTEA